MEDYIEGGTVNPYHGDEGPVIMGLVDDLLEGALSRVRQQLCPTEIVPN